VNAVLSKILAKDSGLNNVKFNLVQEFVEPSTEDEEENGS
jgi:hypothetical protein